MKAPRDHWIIQIEVTNACVHTCSNCTRFCGHHKKPFMMDFETFCKAVDSIIDHPGLIGVMGGEPTLHPDFEKMCLYLNEKLEEKNIANSQAFILPTTHFLDDRREYELKEYELFEYEDGVRPIIKGAGLWTSMTKDYLKYFETIQDTFRFQNLNDHKNISFHQPVLISRGDLGIDDKKWIELREKCWINRHWSSSITPKGCFFCEVAAALDYMYDGPGGLPIEKGWWKKDITEFSEQFKWCEYCGIPLKTFARDAREGITDVSVSNYKMMQDCGCIHLNSKRVNVIDVVDGNISKESMKSVEQYHGVTYIDDAQSRVSIDAPIFVGKLSGVIVSETCNVEIILDSIEKNRKYFDDIYVVDENVISDSFEHYNSISQLLESLGNNKYVMLFTDDVVVSDKIIEIKHCVLNPGTLGYYNISSQGSNSNGIIENLNGYSEGSCLLFNTSARSLRKLDYQAPSMENIRNAWDKNKTAIMDENFWKNVSNRTGFSKMNSFSRVLSGFAKKYGLLKLCKYSFVLFKRYGVKLMISKIKGRVF